MGYEITVELHVKAKSEKAWPALTRREESKLEKVSDDADYVVSNGSGKWYAIASDLATFSQRAKLDVLAEVTGEDGAKSRIYARDGVHCEVRPKVEWTSGPDWAPALDES